MEENAVFNNNILENVIALSASVHGFLNRHFNIPRIVAVKAFYTDAVVKGSDKTVVDIYVYAVVHINSVGVVSPATNDLHIFDA